MTAISNLGVELDIVIMRGATLVLNLTCTDPTSDPPNGPKSLDGCTLRAQIRKAGLSGESLADFTPEITDVVNGKATLTLNSAQTAELVAGESADDPISQYVWDLELTDAHGVVSFPAYGTVSVFRQVSKP